MEMSSSETVAFFSVRGFLTGLLALYRHMLVPMRSPRENNLLGRLFSLLGVDVSLLGRVLERPAWEDTGKGQSTIDIADLAGELTSVPCPPYRSRHPSRPQPNYPTPFVRRLWSPDYWRPPDTVITTSNECCNDVWWRDEQKDMYYNPVLRCLL
jgi:hypothetical protein